MEISSALSAAQSGWQWLVWHICLHFDGYGDWFGRQANEKHKQTHWIPNESLPINMWFTYATCPFNGKLELYVRCIQSYIICCKWCRPHLNGVLLQSFAWSMHVYRNVGPVFSVNETRKKCRLFVHLVFRKRCAGRAKKEPNLFGARIHFNCTLSMLGFRLCRHSIEIRLVRFDACDEFCVRRLQIIHVQRTHQV